MDIYRHDASSLASFLYTLFRSLLRECFVLGGEQKGDSQSVGYFHLYVHIRSSNCELLFLSFSAHTQPAVLLFKKKFSVRPIISRGKVPHFKRKNSTTFFLCLTLFGACFGKLCSNRYRLTRLFLVLLFCCITWPILRCVCFDCRVLRNVFAINRLEN